MTAPTRRPKPRSSPLVDLAHMLWTVPVVSVPFAAFFMLMGGQGWSSFYGYWLVSMIFSTCISLALWITTHFLDPMLERRFADDARMSWWIAGTHLVTSLLGAVAAIFVANATILHGQFLNPRTLVISLVFSLMFGVMFVGIALAFSYYRKAMNRAGSERELQLARRIQRSFLLSEFPRRSRIEVHAVNLSSKEVSGDFYDVVTPNDSEILLAVADVSGKGVPAALLSSMLQASLRTQAGTVASPAAMMTTINALACQRGDTGQFATFFLAVVHEPTLRLRFTNAGHNFPVLLRAGGSRELLERGGVVVGMMEGLPYEEQSLTLAEGDRIVLYTDGVTEAARMNNEMYGEERLYALLDSLPRELTSEQIVARVLAEVRDFLGDAEAGDDITVMALRVLPGAPAGAA
jgi:hypothetical protein